MPLLSFLLSGIVMGTSAQYWPSANHDGRGSNCAHVPLPNGPPTIAWEGPTLGPNRNLPLTPLVDESGTILMLSDSDAAPKAVTWSSTGFIQVLPTFCYGTEPNTYYTAYNFIILPGGCVVAPCTSCRTDTPGGSCFFSLIAVPGATGDPSVCAGIVPWSTQTLEPLDVPFGAILQTPIVDDSGQYVMPISAFAEERCANDEECDSYLSVLALRTGGAKETKITLASCDFVSILEQCFGCGSYTNGVISADVINGGRTLFSINSGGEDTSKPALGLTSINLEAANFQIVPLYDGCTSRLAASTEGTVYCVNGSNFLMGWSAGRPALPSISLAPVGAPSFIAVGQGSTALIIAASGYVLLGASLQLELVWTVMLPGSAGALIIDDNSIVVSTSWGLVCYRVSDGFLLWGSVGLATDATNLVSAAPFSLVAVSPERISYLVAMVPSTSPSASASPSTSVTPPPQTSSLTSTISPTSTTTVNPPQTSSVTSTVSPTCTTTLNAATATVLPSASHSPYASALVLSKWTIAVITGSAIVGGVIFFSLAAKLFWGRTVASNSADNPWLSPLLVNGDSGTMFSANGNY